jgi:hypothetical protein
MSENDESNERTGLVVSIEWDGLKPPTRWYTYLAQNGLSTCKGDSKDVTPLTRRHKSFGRGLAIQEGMIVVESHTLANRLAYMAKSYGAKVVMIGTLHVEAYIASENDVRTFDAVSKVESKRGPKVKAEAGEYTITCLEEGTTVTVMMDGKPYQCPHCAGTRIQYHMGKAPVVKTFNPGEHSIDKYWLATRFATGKFEIPTTSDDAELPEQPNLTNDSQKFHVATVMKFVAKHAEDIDGSGLEILRAMDAAYCIQQAETGERLTRRIEVLREYYANGGTADYKMSVDPLAVDIADVAGIDSRFVRRM